MHINLERIGLYQIVEEKTVVHIDCNTVSYKAFAEFYAVVFIEDRFILFRPVHAEVNHEKGKYHKNHGKGQNAYTYEKLLVRVQMISFHKAFDFGFIGQR